MAAIWLGAFVTQSPLPRLSEKRKTETVKQITPSAKCAAIKKVVQKQQEKKETKKKKLNETKRTKNIKYTRYKKINIYTDTNIYTHIYI